MKKVTIKKRHEIHQKTKCRELQCVFFGHIFSVHILSRIKFIIQSSWINIEAFHLTHLHLFVYSTFDKRASDRNWDDSSSLNVFFDGLSQLWAGTITFRSQQITSWQMHIIVFIYNICALCSFLQEKNHKNWLKNIQHWKKWRKSVEKFEHTPLPGAPNTKIIFGLSNAALIFLWICCPNQKFVLIGWCCCKNCGRTAKNGTVLFTIRFNTVFMNNTIVSANAKHTARANE